MSATDKPNHTGSAQLTALGIQGIFARRSVKEDQDLEDACRTPNRNECLLLAGLLLAALAIRLVGLDQPIVENYVGRQIPTAMVARNLDRGSGFGRPHLDTGPFPNWFVVEPPVFELAAVGLERATGLPLESSGRAVSALGIVLACWGLWGLARRRMNLTGTTAAVAALALFPVSIRYGRAFQPDALMLGTTLAGLRCWDQQESGRGRAWLAAGWCLLACGFALKITSTVLLLPLLVVIERTPKPARMLLAGSTLLPAAAWYLHAAWLIGQGSGSQASAQNAAIWASVLAPTTHLDAAMIKYIMKCFLVSSFTPVGFVVGVWGLMVAVRGGGSIKKRLWVVWGLAVLGSFALLARKLHHEYYWLALAPVVAAGMGLGCESVRNRMGKVGWAGCLAALALCSIYQSRATFRTPVAWSALAEASAEVRKAVPGDALLVAPEALLYASDRRGCRLELDRRSAERAAGEWGEAIDPTDPLGLIEVYRRRGARYVADMGLETDQRSRWRAAARDRYVVLVDRPYVFLAQLDTIKIGRTTEAQAKPASREPKGSH